MEKYFSTKLLYTQKDNQTALKTFLGQLQPSHPFLVDSSDHVLLSGGFPSLCPETQFPLSPSLQLNLDLTSISEENLKKIADAELDRIEAVNIKTYDVDADLRVCVVADKAVELQSFMESYGGVMEIEPLLLNSHHQDFKSITELSITESLQGYEILYSERAPVDKKLCTYCGECGSICPEDCISSSLWVDYNKCTFCKECEKICAVNALDMYGIEEKKLFTPAVILLGGVVPELPHNRSGIYRENDLEHYFRALYSCTIEELVSHDNSHCQYSAQHDIGCTRCVKSCPHGAVSQDESGVKVDHLKCEDCGNCIAACPTGSMQFGRFEDRSWCEYFEKIELEPGTTIIIGSEKDLHELWWKRKKEKYYNVFFIEHSKIESLSDFHLLFLFAIGGHRINILKSEPLAAQSSVAHQINIANHIVESLFGTSFVKMVSTQECSLSLQRSREMVLTSSYTDFSFDNRRAKLIDIIKFLTGLSGENLSANKLLDDFGQINCDASLCTQCMACLNECSIRALNADKKNLSLTYLAGLCVGCGICMKICPEKALSYATDTGIDEKYFETQTLAETEAVACKSCGKVFGTRKSLDRVMQILASRESVNTEHFEYCETCRVVNLFEVEET